MQLVKKYVGSTKNSLKLAFRRKPKKRVFLRNEFSLYAQKTSSKDFRELPDWLLNRVLKNKNCLPGVH